MEISKFTFKKDMLFLNYVLVYSETGKKSNLGIWLIRIYPIWGKENGDESLEIHMTNSSLNKQTNGTFIFWISL